MSHHLGCRQRLTELELYEVTEARTGRKDLCRRTGKLAAKVELAIDRRIASNKRGNEQFT
jgi:hypothetical protein